MILLIVLLATKAPCLLGSQPVRPSGAENRILQQASYFMPTALRRILSKDRAYLISGFEVLPVPNYVEPAGRRLLETDLQERMRVIGRLLDNRPRFPQVAREFGSVARLLVYLNLPEDQSLSSADLDFILQYIEKNGPNLRLVVYDDPGKEVESLPQFLEQMRLRRGRLSQRLKVAYACALQQHSPEELGVRSPLFGIASLVYSHSVNDIARLWLWAWKLAEGDMTGRPEFRN